MTLTAILDREQLRVNALAADARRWQRDAAHARELLEAERERHDDASAVNQQCVIAWGYDMARTATDAWLTADAELRAAREEYERLVDVSTDRQDAYEMGLEASSEWARTDTMRRAYVGAACAAVIYQDASGTPCYDSDCPWAAAADAAEQTAAALLDAIGEIRP